jgi:hypothetical protein
MERQHALRVDELDSLVQQYRSTIWHYESKVEGLEKELDRFKKQAAPRPKVDLQEFATVNEGETIEDVRAKNTELLREYEVIAGDLDLAEGQRDAAKREADALRRELEAAQQTLAQQTDENYKYRDQVSKLQKEKATAVTTAGVPGGGAQPPSVAGTSTTTRTTVVSGTTTVTSGGGSGAPGVPQDDGSFRGGQSAADAMASGDSAAAEAIIREQAATAAAAQEAAVAAVSSQYDELRKKLLHTCVDLLDEFDEKRVTTAKELIETELTH